MATTMGGDSTIWCYGLDSGTSVGAYTCVTVRVGAHNSHCVRRDVYGHTITIIMFIYYNFKVRQVK